MGCAKSTENQVPPYTKAAQLNQKYEQPDFNPYQIKVIEPVQKQNETTNHQLFKQFENENTDEQLNKSGLPKWKPSRAEQNDKVNAPINNSDINIQISISASDGKPKTQSAQVQTQMKVIPEEPIFENRHSNQSLAIMQELQGFNHQNLKVKLQDRPISKAEVSVPNFFGESHRNQNELMGSEQVADIWKFKLSLPKIQILSA